MYVYSSCLSVYRTVVVLLYTTQVLHVGLACLNIINIPLLCTGTCVHIHVCGTHVFQELKNTRIHLTFLTLYQVDTFIIHGWSRSILFFIFNYLYFFILYTQVY
jgi:hypothetical protein